MTLTDRALVDGAMRGEPRALEAFVRLAAPTLQACVGATLLRCSPPGFGDGALRETVKEVVQSVLIGLLEDDARRLRKWEPERGGLKTFLRVVARSRARSHLRKRARLPWREIPTADQPLAIHLEATRHPSIEDRVALRQVLDRAHAQLIAATSEKGKQLWDLLFEQDLPLAEVQAASGLSAAAVHKWRSRLRAQFRAIVVELVPEAAVW